MFRPLHGLVVAVFLALLASQGDAQVRAFGAPGGENLSVADLGLLLCDDSDVLLSPHTQAASVTLVVNEPETSDPEVEEEDPTSEGYSLARPCGVLLPMFSAAGRWVGPASYWGTWLISSGRPRAPPLH